MEQKISGAVLRVGVRRVLEMAGYDMRRMPWGRDAEFHDAYNQIRRATLVDITRCWQLWDMASRVPSGGDIIEIGVWRGGTGCLLALKAKQLGCEAFLCDTFSGVVKAGSEDDSYRNGEHSDASPEDVLSLAVKLGVSPRVLKGVFPEETGYLVADKVFRMAHIDVDVYRSSRDATEWIWPRLVQGGALIFDDYGFERCKGVRRFVDEWARGVRCPVVQSVTSQAIIFKV